MKKNESHKESSFFYENVFLYASLQFCGNIEEYFSRHTKNLVVFIVMPRPKNTYNLLRHYENGSLVSEKKVFSHPNLFLYYASWYLEFLKALFSVFSAKDRVFVIAFHPISLFGMSIITKLRNVEYVYWIGDYFPPVNLSLRLFEGLKKKYHKAVRYSCYLSDQINKKMNGKVIQSKNHQTVMWGVKPKNIERSLISESFTMLFVGLIKESQGIESVLAFLKDNPGYKVKIIGICPDNLYQKYNKIIESYRLSKRVYFPNEFVDDEKLLELSKDCHVGIALYDIDQNNATNFADPGKVKAYAEIKLPVIMSNISDIAQYVNKFHSGIVIDNNKDLVNAFTKIKENYANYLNGVSQFNNHFAYDAHYKKYFSFLENK